MRPVALVLRAGAVVVVAGFVFSRLVGESPPSVAEQAPVPPKAVVEEKPPPVVKPKPKPPAGVVTIAAVGDVMMGSTPELPPNGGRTFFDDVGTDLAADVVLGNLEGTLSTGGRSACPPASANCHAFQTPPSYAKWLAKAGFTVMNLANNHALDYGPSGQEQTIKALRGNGLALTGRPGEITVQRVGELRVAILGFAPYSWAQRLTDITAAKQLVRKAAAKADIVIVTMHAGAEGADRAHVRPGTETYLGENRGNAVAFSHAVVDAGADLVVGHGPHVLRGIEWYRDRLIAYSLGNFAGYKAFALEGPLSVSAILRVTLRADGGLDTATLVPIRLEGAGVPMLDPDRNAIELVRTLSRGDFGERGVKVSASGIVSR